MKKIFSLILTITLILIFSIRAYASEIAIITGYDVRFRTAATTNSNIITNFNPGVELALLDKNAGTGNGCDSKWYKVQYGSTVGYICGDFAKVEEVKEIKPEDYPEYSEYLKELGFPDTYINKLLTLHAKHPEWKFEPMPVALDFNSLISKEYDGYYKGWSLIEDTGSYNDGYKSFDSWSYNYLNDTFSTNFNGGGKYWYAAGKSTIAYYVDPRNFINENQIFMFETLSYNSSYHTKEGIELMLKGTFMANSYSDEENQKTYADAFLDAAIQHHISPYVLVSRVIQEIGAQGSTIVSGTVKGYEGYYNFYNINAAGKTAEETIANGLIYAKEKGWNTKYKAIIGGASFLVKGYLDAGQDTLYLQKWDVVGPDYVNHQYMQNIQAPMTESSKTYKGYNNLSLIDSAFVFKIPVYLNMPNETKLPQNGNPNNYLSSLAVNGDYLFEKATTKKDFNLNLDINTQSIDISATKVSSKSTISGTGSISLSGEKQTIKINVTAQNGDVRTYSINITRDGTKAISVSEILRVINIKNDGTYMYGFNVGTDISTIKKNIIDKEPKAEVNSFNKDGKSKTEGAIASGDKIKIKTETEEKEYTIIIYGDVNSDGKITSADYIKVKNHIMDVNKLNSNELLFGDANKDGKVNSADYVTIKNHIMEVKSIVQ